METKDKILVYGGLIGMWVYGTIDLFVYWHSLS